jgi:hypothetical protein
MSRGKGDETQTGLRLVEVNEISMNLGLQTTVTAGDLLGDAIHALLDEADMNPELFSMITIPPGNEYDQLLNKCPATPSTHPDPASPFIGTYNCKRHRALAEMGRTCSTP